MGIKRLASKPAPARSPEKADTSDSDEDAATAKMPLSIGKSTAVAAETQQYSGQPGTTADLLPAGEEVNPAGVGTCQDEAAKELGWQIVVAESGEGKVSNRCEDAISSPVDQKSEARVDGIASVFWEPGKRMRKKGSFMPRSGTVSAAADKSPGLQDAINCQLVALDSAASPGVGSPAANTFPARRRSIASPARASSSEGGMPMHQARASAGKGGTSSSSDSDSSSSSSSSSSASSGEPEESIAQSNQWGCPFKEGQRFPTPAVSDTARDFFVTLLEEKPDSYIATQFLVEHGVFSLPKHNQLLKRYKIQKELRLKAQAERLASGSPSRTRKPLFSKKQGVPKIVMLHKRPKALKKI